MSFPNNHNHFTGKKAPFNTPPRKKKPKQKRKHKNKKEVKVLEKSWTADVVGRMHEAGITGLQLAEECGYTNSYVSSVLHCKKGDEKTKQKILDGPGTPGEEA